MAIPIPAPPRARERARRRVYSRLNPSPSLRAQKARYARGRWPRRPKKRRALPVSVPFPAHGVLAHKADFTSAGGIPLFCPRGGCQIEVCVLRTAAPFSRLRGGRPGAAGPRRQSSPAAGKPPRPSPPPDVVSRGGRGQSVFCLYPVKPPRGRLLFMRGSVIIKTSAKGKPPHSRGGFPFRRRCAAHDEISS